MVSPKLKTQTLTCVTSLQGTVMGDLNKRKGIIQGSEQEADDTIMTAHVPLASMFGYSTDLRSMTQVGAPSTPHPDPPHTSQRLNMCTHSHQ